MSISELEQYRLEKAVRSLCSGRNQSTPAELGKVQYEIYSGGVIFSKLSFLLDSVHCNGEYPIAKLEYDNLDKLWGLYVAKHDERGEDVVSWQPYPHLTKQETFDLLLATIEQDPEGLFW